MALTMSGVLEGLTHNGGIFDCAEKVAITLLRGARGNSGVILSLFFRGLAKQFKGNETADIELIAKAFALMSRAGCTGELFIQIAEKQYVNSPSAETAIRLASIFENRKEFERALKYLNESLATEEDPAAKANLYVRIAASELGSNKASAAGAAARQAITLNPANGYAYLMLAQAYASSASSCDGISAQAVYWLVTDVLAKARGVFADDPAQVSSIDSQIATYRAYFPNNEECFFNGLSEGQSYTVKCGWINASTVVRPRK
jgi:tetratricopeptide (TPR) repeat protein